MKKAKLEGPLTDLAGVSSPSGRARAVERSADIVRHNGTSTAVLTRRCGANIVNHFAICPRKAVGTFAQVLVRLGILAGASILARLASSAIIQIYFGIEQKKYISTFYNGISIISNWTGLHGITQMVELITQSRPIDYLMSIVGFKKKGATPKSVAFDDKRIQFLSPF